MHVIVVEVRVSRVVNVMAMNCSFISFLYLHLLTITITSSTEDTEGGKKALVGFVQLY